MVTKFDIENFSEDNNFGLWRFKMKVFLIQQDCTKTSKGDANMLVFMSKKEKTNMISEVRSTIILCFGAIRHQEKSLRRKFLHRCG